MLDLLIVAALAGSIPITDDSVDAVCNETERIDCSLPVTPSRAGASLSAPGFDIYISDVVWDDDGLEPGSGAYSGVAFDRRIDVHSPDIVPTVGMFGLSVACATPEGEFVRFTEDNWDDVAFEMWNQNSEPSSIESIAANTDAYGYAEITDLCSADERRAIVAVGMWAEDITALTPGFEPGWVGGVSTLSTLGGLSYRFIAPEGSYEDTSPQIVTLLLGDFQYTNRNEFCDAFAADQLLTVGMFSTPAGSQNKGISCADFWPSGQSLPDMSIDLSFQPVNGGLDHLTVKVGSDERLRWYPPGHMLYEEAATLAGWSATLALSDALDDVVFIPGDEESNLGEIPGMCIDWVDCVTYCDDVLGFDLPQYFQCLVVPPFDVGEVIDALREDLLQGPIVAYSRVLLSNAERVMIAVANVGEQCGPIASFDFGTIGEVDINTCEVPSGWRSLVRIVFSALISVASLMLVARLMLSAVGLQGVLDFGRHNGVDS